MPPLSCITNLMPRQVMASYALWSFDFGSSLLARRGYRNGSYPEFSPLILFYSLDWFKNNVINTWWDWKACGPYAYWSAKTPFLISSAPCTSNNSYQTAWLTVLIVPQLRLRTNKSIEAFPSKNAVRGIHLMCMGKTFLLDRGNTGLRLIEKSGFSSAAGSSSPSLITLF